MVSRATVPITRPFAAFAADAPDFSITFNPSSRSQWISMEASPSIQSSPSIQASSSLSSRGSNGLENQWVPQNTDTPASMPESVEVGMGQHNRLSNARELRSSLQQDLRNVEAKSRDLRRLKASQDVATGKLVEASRQRDAEIAHLKEELKQTKHAIQALAAEQQTASRESELEQMPESELLEDIMPLLEASQKLREAIKRKRQLAAENLTQSLATSVKTQAQVLQTVKELKESILPANSAAPQGACLYSADSWSALCRLYPASMGSEQLSEQAGTQITSNPPVFVQPPADIWDCGGVNREIGGSTI